MNSQSLEVWILTQKLNLKDIKIRNLKQRLKFLRYSNMIERQIYKHSSMKQYNTLIRLSDEFLNYAQTHPDDDTTDYDTDDEAVEFPEETFTIDEFCKKYDWHPEKVHDLRETFSL
jgi:hypothetical protein